MTPQISLPFFKKKPKSKKITLYSDGGARGNPGPAGIGYVLLDEKGKTLAEEGAYIGEATNNQAEYKALLAGLMKAQDLGAEEVDCYLDSELAVKQLNGEYKVKNEGLKPIFTHVRSFYTVFRKITFSHVRREKNKRADAMVNVAIDKHFE